MKTAVDFLKDDWSSLAPFYRISFVFGSSLIFLTWLKDHWGNWHYNIYNYDFGFLSFYTGLFFIVFGFIVGVISLIAKELHRYIKISDLKRKYPREKLGKNFNLFTATGKIYLVDKDIKYWIANGSTYIDLNFFWGDEKRVTQVELDKLTEGNLIITRGRPGRD